MVLANSLAVMVFATPGTPSIRECPLAKMEIINSSIISSCPIMTLPNSFFMPSTAACNLLRSIRELNSNPLLSWFSSMLLFKCVDFFIQVDDIIFSMHTFSF